MGCTVKMIKDTINPYNGIRLTTLQLRYWRSIHSEFMTHRVYCLDGDSILEFDLPGGNHKNNSHKRVFYMSLKEFVEKWHSGDSLGRSMLHRLTQMKIRQLNTDTKKVVNCLVKDCYISGKKEVFEIMTEDGKKVAGSKDHRILTTNGWKTIKELQVNEDFIIIEKRGKFEEDYADELRYKRINGKWRSTWHNQIKKNKLKDQDYRCLDCKKDLNFTPVDIHHIIPINEDTTKAFDYDNVVALCKECHKKKHKIQGWQHKNYLYGLPKKLISIKSLGIKETYDLEMDSEYDNFIANGIVVHNSRNASSSRAIPISTMLKQVWFDPAGPIFWGANQAGMKARVELTGWKKWVAQKFWYGSGKLMCGIVWTINKLVSPHKQVFNRLLEPWQYISVIVTGTEWKNFLELRDHPDAQPEIRELAILIRDAMAMSNPETNKYHLPYISECDTEMFDMDKCMKLSAARCARVSYLTHDGKLPDPDKDIALFNSLVNTIPPHASPIEHQAIAVEDTGFIKNIRGWKSFRKILEEK